MGKSEKKIGFRPPSAQWGRGMTTKMQEKQDFFSHKYTIYDDVMMGGVVAIKQNTVYNYIFYKIL